MGNQQLRKHAKELAEGNKMMRTELRTLQTKFGEGKDFIAESLKETDDSKAKELMVLKTSTHRKHPVADIEVEKSTKRDDDDEEDKDDDDDDSDEGESFLAMSSKTRRMSLETEDTME